MDPTPQREYRIMPELRRCCWYAIIGAVVLSGVAHWTMWFAQIRRPGGVVVSYVMFSLLIGAMVLALLWRLRVNGDGMSRWLLYRWDRWSWSDLGSGRIRKLHPHTLYDPARPWWRRRLDLGHLSPDDVHEVLSIMNAHYRLPPPPEVPETLTLKYGWRRSVTFDRNGVHLIVGDKLREYLWTEVREVHITRMDPLRRDFASLLLVLPTEEIELKLVTHQGGTSPTWRGAAADEINEFLHERMPGDRIHVSIAGRPPTERRLIERELADLQARTRALLLTGVIGLTTVLGMLVWEAIGGAVLKAIFRGAMFAIFPGVPLVWMYRLQRKRITEQKDVLNSILSTSRESAGTIRI